MTIGTSTGAHGGHRQRWFLAALLVALFSALVPAVLSTGFPASRHTGSAFDPATSSVALRSRAQRIDRPVLLQRDDAREPAIVLPVLAPERLAERPLPAAAHPGIAFPQRPAPPQDLRHLTDARPRAPPHPNG